MSVTALDLNELAKHIKQWAISLGFADVGISDLDVSTQKQDYLDWLAAGFAGEMQYLHNNLDLRFDASLLHPGTLRVISVRMNYLPEDAQFAQTLLDDKRAYISRYALGRDYHKLMRKRLKQLGEQIKQHCAQLDYRPFVDSAPVLERVYAQKAGLGWTGKHSLIINQQQGSWSFLGELLVNIPLPVDKPVDDKCGHCVACLRICPTNAIVAPYQVDARRCISYLTIEYDGIIAEELRPLLGNRIYGCDDCQLICPWNRFASLTAEDDFAIRHQLNQRSLLELFAWDERQFLQATEGMAIRRIGHQQWLRNIAIALGNARFAADIVAALQQRRSEVSELVQIHIDWALTQQQSRQYEENRKTARLGRAIQKALPRDA